MCLKLKILKNQNQERMLTLENSPKILCQIKRITN